MKSDLLSAPADPYARVVGRWHRALRKPGWHMRLADDLRRYILARPADAAGWQVRWAIYDLVAAALEDGEVALPPAGVDRDAGREAVRSAVLHHSGTLPGISRARLSAMGLLRLYAPSAVARADAAELYSHHYRNGLPVFYAYHWIVRPDGAAERLLHDHEVGWHAGDREVNRASVGICLAGDYSREPPTTAALAAIRALLRERYPRAALIPHCAVNRATDCPGPWVRALGLEAYTEA